MKASAKVPGTKGHGKPGGGGTTPPPTGGVVTVTTIAGLKAALADNTIGEIVVTNGTYQISTSSAELPNSLWIGSAYASRTLPVLVRAASVGGVIFDGGGGQLGGISFEQGAHDQTWDGFKFQNGTVNSTGCIMFGGYPYVAPAHHITLKHFTVTNTVHKVNVGSATDHAMYFSYGLNNGPHDIVIEDFTVIATSVGTRLASAVHMDHGYAEEAPNVSANTVTVRRLVVQGTDQAIILWSPPTHNWLFDGGTIDGASQLAIRYESQPGTNIVFKDITSTSSGGFYSSSQGPTPPGVTFTNCNLG